MADPRDSMPVPPKHPPQVIKYARPDMNQVEGKAIIRLVQSDVMLGNVQIIKDGGDNNLHSHAGMDGFWYVIRGKARFYGTLEETVIAELNAGEGVYIPRNYPYWFEKFGDEDLELLQLEAIDRSVRNIRTDYHPQKEATDNLTRFDMNGKVLNYGLDKRPTAAK